MHDVLFSSEERQRAQVVLPLAELATRGYLQENGDLPAILTAKEREIVGVMRKGANSELIARQLDISPSAVETHLRNIFTKTEVINRIGLASRTWIPVTRCMTYL